MLNNKLDTPCRRGRMGAWARWLRPAVSSWEGWIGKIVRPSWEWETKAQRLVLGDHNDWLEGKPEAQATEWVRIVDDSSTGQEAHNSFYNHANFISSNKPVQTALIANYTKYAVGSFWVNPGCLCTVSVLAGMIPGSTVAWKHAPSLSKMTSRSLIAASPWAGLIPHIFEAGWEQIVLLSIILSC